MDGPLFSVTGNRAPFRVGSHVNCDNSSDSSVSLGPLGCRRGSRGITFDNNRFRLGTSESNGTVSLSKRTRDNQVSTIGRCGRGIRLAFGGLGASNSDALTDFNRHMKGRGLSLRGVAVSIRNGRLTLLRNVRVDNGSSLIGSNGAVGDRLSCSLGDLGMRGRSLNDNGLALGINRVSNRT